MQLCVFGMKNALLFAHLDAFYEMVSRDSRSFTGNFCIDEQILKEAGIDDFEQYAMEPGQPLMPDFFVDDDTETANKMRTMADKAFSSKGDSQGKAKSSSAGASDTIQSPAAVFDAVGQKLKANPDPKLKGSYGFEIDGKLITYYCKSSLSINTSRSSKRLYGVADRRLKVYINVRTDNQRRN